MATDTTGPFTPGSTEPLTGAVVTITAALDTDDPAARRTATYPAARVLGTVADHGLCPVLLRDGEIDLRAAGNGPCLAVLHDGAVITDSRTGEETGTCGPGTWSIPLDRIINVSSPAAGAAAPPAARAARLLAAAGISRRRAVERDGVATVKA